MMAEACGLSVWPSSFALESKLSRNLESHPGLVPRLSHHGGKNHRPAGSKTKIDYAQCHRDISMTAVNIDNR
ncbi:MAG: hypothetical protein IK058_03445 [Bacteroidales bacterium]|nr:hypothetical protein [Bacteroidales bacterium]